MNNLNMMINDTGIIVAVLEHFEKQCLPRIVEIKQRLDDGLILNEFEIEYLSCALHDTQSTIPYLARHPEYEPLFSKLIHYFKLITDEALDNTVKYN